MNKTIAITVASALLLAGTSALAQTRMRPGLWEHSFTMKSQSGEMERSMGAAQTRSSVLRSMRKERSTVPVAVRRSSGTWISAVGDRVSWRLARSQA